MGHRDREILMHRDHRLGGLSAARLGLGEGLDDRREISARIGEEIFDAALGEEREIGLGDAVDQH